MNESSILNVETDKYNEQIISKIKLKAYLATKRIFDIIIASLGLIILSPIFLIVSIMIKKEDNGKIFLIQERIGKDGKIFKLYKFRSMVNNADEILKEMLKNSKTKYEYEKKMKLTNDPRITKIGEFIRKTSIDELPQLLNVLKGEMSLIGNRPYLPREKQQMKSYYNDIVKTKPGITGYWQVKGRSNIKFKERLKLEQYYSNNMSITLDIKIFFLTFYVVFKGEGAK